MIWNHTLQTILNTVVREASEDLVGLWLVENWVRDAFPRLELAEVRVLTLEIVRRGIGDSGIIIGSFSESSFEHWPRQSDAMSRLEKQCLNAVSRLGPNDNVWLSGKDLNYQVR